VSGGILLLGISMLLLAGLRVEITVSDKRVGDAGSATSTRAFAVEVAAQGPWRWYERQEAGAR
jgi:hypothetical protein